MSLTVKTSEIDFVSRWEEAAEAHANREALITSDRSYTYAQVDSVTSSIAGRLREHKIGLECFVGLDFDRPTDFVLGAVATLKAGAAFVIEGGLAKARRRDAQNFPAALTATLSRKVQIDPAIKTSGMIDISQCEALLPASASWRENLVSHHQAAYLLFTSGTTGRPKAVVIERANLGALCQAIRQRLELTSSDRWFQIASPAFDVFIEEVFPILTAGGAVVCRPTLEALNFHVLHESLSTCRATIVEMSTQYWYGYQRWLNSTGNFPPLDVRSIIVGGEQMDVKAYRNWQNRYGTALIHVYGITEATVSSTTFHGNVSENAEDVPVGRALSNSRIHIGELPLGLVREEDEVALAGMCVGRGYYDDPALTAELFVPDPEGEPGSRRYLTGDIGFVNAEGDLVLKGRTDDQIKVRGMRIRCSTIESALQSIAGIARAVVIADPVVDSNLAAFLIFSERSHPARQGIRPIVGNERAALYKLVPTTIPPWALPGRLFEIEDLPGTISGKVDRIELARRIRVPKAALNLPAVSNLDSLADMVLLCFQTVLQSKDFGFDDSFFDFGGDSLLALSLVCKISEATGAEVKTQLIFEAPTPRQLAEQLHSKRQGRVG
jgi:amino acid adenylation domain-containing protein